MSWHGQKNSRRGQKIVAVVDKIKKLVAAVKTFVVA